MQAQTQTQTQTQPQVRTPAQPAAPAAARATARQLGWFSIALGFAQLLVPRALARMSGARPHVKNKALMRAIGARELISGAGLLLWPRSQTFAWMRFAGDVMDVALLSRAMFTKPSARGAFALASVSGVAALDWKTARALTHSQQRSASAQERKNMRTIKSITINKPSDEVRSAWMNVVESNVPNDRVIVRFSPARMGRATEVRLELLDVPASGLLATALARLTGAATPGDLDRALKQFKQIVELGEVTHSDASVHHGPHPARPSTIDELKEEVAS